ncbi:hypothetical protein NDU88_004063 [Pleurodeles waltl]|uniref:Uncharacterized protein n=1 Tax=Pleurodeles waltl TaxID=8319 RepID=A0AAV7V480_PLEWA|nr:hypothetical protein NDU88_004063 [Pleurodeles waltl]
MRIRLGLLACTSRQWCSSTSSPATGVSSDPQGARPPGLSKGSRGPICQKPWSAQGAQVRAHFSPVASAVPRQDPVFPKPSGTRGRQRYHPSPAAVPVAVTVPLQALLPSRAVFSSGAPVLCCPVISGQASMRGRMCLVSVRRGIAGP